jgi:formamidopyrimidine-DNA glycosylase
MPELPEVETVRRDLDALVRGRRVADAIVTGARTVRRTSAAALRTGVVGRTITGTGRRGKYLLIDLDDGNQVMVHLRMSGQLLVGPAATSLALHTHVRLVLDDGRELRFVDPRTFGEVAVIDPDQLERDAPDLAALGPEPLEVDRKAFDRIIRSRNRQVKALLTDQRIIAGVGNIYADEIDFAARIRPDRLGSSLTGPELGRLHSEMQSILSAAIEARGSTLRDAQYVDLGGLSGGYQADHHVYDREGEPCHRCGREVSRVPWSGRSTYFCRRCQR